jgi:uncharacterized Fe-S cluster-containing radical SAM superfamily protein
MKIFSDVEVSVEIEINDPDIFERITGPGGDEWRAQLYDLRTKGDVVRHIAFNAIMNNLERVNQLDGWADLPNDAGTMQVARDIEYGSWYERGPAKKP